MGIDLRQLRYLVTTVDAGSATKAAAVLHVTQPVLSRQLRQFQRRLGVDLLEVRAGRMALTPAGRSFLPMARDLLRQADAAERAARELAAGRLERVHVAAPATTLTDVLAPWLATLSADDPLITVSELGSRTPREAFDAGADLVVSARPAPEPTVSRLFATLPVWAYVPPADPWATRRTVEITELVERPLLLLDRSLRARRLFDQAVDAAGLSPVKAEVCQSPQVAQALAAAGRGVAVVTDDPRFDLVPLRMTGVDGRPVVIRLYLGWQATHHAARALDLLADRLTEFVAQRYPEDR